MALVEGLDALGTSKRQPVAFNISENATREGYPQYIFSGFNWRTINAERSENIEYRIIGMEGTSELF